MNGGPIGGVKQTGRWKLGARFNKSDLRRRCEKVSEYRDRVEVSGLDGIEFIEKRNASSTMFFIDPPYFRKGQTLYLSDLDVEYHAALADRLREMSEESWVLTYDDCPEIREMYAGWASVRPFGLRYAAAERRSGREVLITPPWMELPSSQLSAALTW
jgi:DNA adenine methylase